MDCQKLHIPLVIANERQAAGRGQTTPLMPGIQQEPPIVKKPRDENAQCPNRVTRQPMVEGVPSTMISSLRSIKPGLYF